MTRFFVTTRKSFRLRPFSRTHLWGRAREDRLGDLARECRSFFCLLARGPLGLTRVAELPCVNRHRRRARGGVARGGVAPGWGRILKRAGHLALASEIGVGHRHLLRKDATPHLQARPGRPLWPAQSLR